MKKFFIVAFFTLMGIVIPWVYFSILGTLSNNVEFLGNAYFVFRPYHTFFLVLSTEYGPQLHNITYNEEIIIKSILISIITNFSYGLIASKVWGKDFRNNFPKIVIIAGGIILLNILFAVVDILWIGSSIT